jgi:hypothetical protein
MPTEIKEPKVRKEVNPEEVLQKKIERADDNVRKIEERVTSATGEEKERLTKLLELHKNYRESLK